MLHLFAAIQTPNKIYDQVFEIGPETSSTGFISETVKAQEAYNQKKNKKASQLREEVIWKLNNWKPSEGQFLNKQQPNKEQQPQRNQQSHHAQQQTQRNQQPYAQQQQNNNKRTLACFNCGKTDH